MKEINNVTEFKQDGIIVMFGDNYSNIYDKDFIPLIYPENGELPLDQIINMGLFSDNCDFREKIVIVTVSPYILKGIQENFKYHHENKKINYYYLGDALIDCGDDIDYLYTQCDYNNLNTKG